MLLRYRIDLVSIALVVGVLALQAVALIVPLPWLTVVPIIVGVRWIHLVEHNHAHLSITRKRSIDEALGWIMFLSGGVPLEAYRIFHVQTHHRYTNKSADWTSPFAYEGAHFPDRPVNFVYYTLTYSLIALCQFTVSVLRRPNSTANRRFFASLAVVGAASVALAYLDAARFLVFFCLPWLVIYLGAPVANWFQHVGCDDRAPETCANVNLSVLCGRFGFNIGYHSAHHMRPALHWSKLAAYHWGEVAAHVPDRFYRPVPLEKVRGTNTARRRGAN